MTENKRKRPGLAHFFLKKKQILSRIFWQCFQTEIESKMRHNKFVLKLLKFSPFQSFHSAKRHFHKNGIQLDFLEQEILHFYYSLYFHLFQTQQ